MTQVTMNRAPKDGAAASPSQILTEKMAQEYVVPVSTGRRITLKKPGLLAQYRLVQVLGGETAANAVYMNMVLPITFVVAIDGIPVPAPTRFAEVEALIQRLDEHGLNACVAGLKEHFGASETSADEVIAQVKT